ncbi:hypothetical protein EFP17_00215 (plasmid) [Burkholderia glumae]|nr:hypothetical protein CEQ24_011700 [Burkholderia glumae]UVS88363.1 hypothetical protein EFP17_00215 [Burkholderia glumae]
MVKFVLGYNFFLAGPIARPQCPSNYLAHCHCFVRTDTPNLSLENSRLNVSAAQTTSCKESFLGQPPTPLLTEDIDFLFETFQDHVCETERIEFAA